MVFACLGLGVVGAGSRWCAGADDEITRCLDTRAFYICPRVNPDGDRIYLTIGPPGPCNRIVVINVADGRVLGTVQPQP